MPCSARSTAPPWRGPDPGREHVLELAVLGVEADLLVVGALHVLDDDPALEPGVDRDLADGLLERPADDGPTGAVVIGAAAQLVYRLLGTKQSDTTTRDDAFLHSSAGGRHGVLDAVLSP